MSKIKINMDSLQSKKSWKRHKIVDGHNIYRILPPFGENSNGYPYRKWQITWGLLDPSNGRKRPFASCISTEGKCPILEYVTALSEKAEEMKSSLKAQGMSDADIKEDMKDINAVISNLRPKTTYVYNAINKAGEVGLLEVKTTAHKKLKTLMMEYIQDYNQDPTSLNSSDDDSGVWFDFIRTGVNFDTEYDVRKNQIKARVGAQLTYVDDREALPDAVVQNYEHSAYDLSSIYSVKSYDELKEILMANLKTLVAANPDLAVDGFDDFDEVADIAVDGDDAQAPKAQTRTTTTSKPTTTNKVNLKFGSDEEESDDDVPVVRKPTQKVVAKNTAPADDDVFALADSILNS